MGGLLDESPLVGGKIAEIVNARTLCMKPNIPFEEARRRAKKFPQIRKSTVYEKWMESLPLERKERKVLGLGDLYRTADRMPIHCNPANADARNATKPRPRQKKPVVSVIVYLVRFTSITNPTHTFLKVGVTNSLKERFELDCYRYTVKCIAASAKMTRREALKIERQLHGRFKEKGYVPEIKLLSKGNSECFLDDDEIIQDALKVLSIKGYSLA